MTSGVQVGSGGDPRADRGCDRGSGTILAVGLVGVVTTLLLAGLLVSAAAIAGQRARTAADLAALGAAGAALSGADAVTACTLANELATANGAALTRCELVPDSGARGDGSVGPAVEITVARAVSGTAWTVTAQARAGGVAAP